jgi:3-oxoacyl-[acyl-carrier-protein] synthase I
VRPLILTGLCVTSAIGTGLSATLAALHARKGGLRRCDFADISMDGYIGRIEDVEDHRLPHGLHMFDCRNNRLADIALSTDGFIDAVARARNRYGSGRIAVVVGTSTSGILSSEEAYRHRDPSTGALPQWFNYEGSSDHFSLARFVRTALELRGPVFSLSTACASSSKSFLDAAHLIESGICDAAVVGGADSLCRTTLRGFASLDLISPEPCRPCDAGRSGISIGEAAGFALLERDGPGIGVALLGCGATSDGYHMSAPDPQGTGAIGAMQQALATARLPPSSIDYVNLHGTGTRANDAMEDSAVTSVFGRGTFCSSTKGWSGHTLGAAGILEAAIAVLCLNNDFLPGCLGIHELDQTFHARILTQNVETPVRYIVSNSFGFGGINCSLLLGRTRCLLQ